MTRPDHHDARVPFFRALHNGTSPAVFFILSETSESDVPGVADWLQRLGWPAHTYNIKRRLGTRVVVFASVCSGKKKKSSPPDCFSTPEAEEWQGGKRPAGSVVLAFFFRWASAPIPNRRWVVAHLRLVLPR